MSKGFEFYISGFLFAKGISKNEEFETSCEDFGTLIFDGKNIIEDEGEILSSADATFILENTRLFKNAE